MGSHAIETQASLDALRKLVRGLRLSAARAEKSLGVSGAQLFVLEQLRARPKQSLRDLALGTRTDPSSVSAVVQRLLAAKLVTRTAGADDARRAEISLSARGRTLLARGPKALQANLVSALDALAAAERKALANILGKVVSRLGLEDAPLFFEGERRAR